MKYKEIIEGIFLERPNRFIANVLINGKEEIVHVKNTGRCKELLIRGTRVYLSVSDNPSRKTKYDLIAVEKVVDDESILINMDSQIPNDVAYEWLKKGELFGKSAKIKREVKYKNSRFDFYIENEDKKAFLEVKGVTLESKGIARFPDAPTQRGIKHINELISSLEEGYCGYILFVIQMEKVNLFEPNIETHMAFADALNNAQKKGVNIIAMNCIVTPDSIDIKSPVKTLI